MDRRAVREPCERVLVGLGSALEVLHRPMDVAEHLSFPVVQRIHRHRRARFAERVLVVPTRHQCDRDLPPEPVPPDLFVEVAEGVDRRPEVTLGRLVVAGVPVVRAESGMDLAACPRIRLLRQLPLEVVDRRREPIPDELHHPRVVTRRGQT